MAHNPSMGSGSAGSRGAQGSSGMVNPKKRRAPGAAGPGSNDGKYSSSYIITNFYLKYIDNRSGGIAVASQ